MALTEVYEVATFYAHFDVVKEGELPPPPVTVRVCNSLSCAMAGAAQRFADQVGVGAGECAGIGGKDRVDHEQAEEPDGKHGRKRRRGAKFLRFHS